MTSPRVDPHRTDSSRLVLTTSSGRRWIVTDYCMSVANEAQRIRRVGDPLADRREFSPEDGLGPTLWCAPLAGMTLLVDDLLFQLRGAAVAHQA